MASSPEIDRSITPISLISESEPALHEVDVECGGLPDLRTDDQYWQDMQDMMDIDSFVTVEDLMDMDESDEDLVEMRTKENTILNNLVGATVVTDCVVCYEKCTLNLRLCCYGAVCSDCMKTYVETQLNEGLIKVECPCAECRALLHRDEIMVRLDREDKERFYRFLSIANQKSNIKTCPKCSTVMEIPQEDLKRKKSHPESKNGIRVTCSDCDLLWCFPCQAPWHDGISCKDYNKGDKLLRSWAKTQTSGQANAQKCPKCKVFIQRSSGCDHMQCSRCDTSFCYRCGKRFLKLKFLGNHYSKFSVFGCKYRLLPDKPAQRRLIRGAILGSELLLAPAVGGAAVVAGGVLLGLSTILLPVFGVIKLARHFKANKRHRQQCRRRDAAERDRMHTEVIMEAYPYMPNLEPYMQTLDIRARAKLQRRLEIMAEARRNQTVAIQTANASAAGLPSEQGFVPPELATIYADETARIVVAERYRNLLSRVKRDITGTDEEKRMWAALDQLTGVTYNASDYEDDSDDDDYDDETISEVTVETLEQVNVGRLEPALATSSLVEYYETLSSHL